MSSPVGACKVCRSGLHEIDKRLARGDTLKSIVEWCADRGFQVTRQKLADHRVKKHRVPAIRRPASDRHVTNCCCEQLRQELLRVLAR